MSSFIIAVIETGLPIIVLSTLSEYVWHNKKRQREYVRKFIHITAGTYAAFWPWFIGWRNIELLALGALVALILSRLLKLYRSLHETRRSGAGEFFAVFSLGVLPFVTHNRWVFLSSMLCLSLADGLAAVLGVRFGKNNTYKIFKMKKSLVGTFSCWLVSLIILTIYLAINHSSNWLILSWLPLSVAALENIGIYGSDNSLIPLGVAFVLRFVT